MWGMGINDSLKRLVSTLGKVVTATAMGMHADKAWHDIHTACVNEMGTGNGQVTIGYFQNFSIAHQH